MSHQVTIKPSGHLFHTQNDETILEAALREGFALPYGCRNGACGTCKGKILEGSVDYGSYQATALTEDEKLAGYALFCCARPQSDLLIEVREIGAAREIPIKTLPCRVQAMEQVAPDVMVLSLKLPANERLQFLAGQYVDILLKDGRRRSFSLANAPHDDELLQLHVRNVPGGTFTESVFTQLKEKDILRFEGPLGTFFLHEDSAKPILFVAGGTGFAPVKAMIEHAFHVGSGRPMTLYWGARAKRDLYMPQLPEEWSRAQPGFRFVPVLSEPVAADMWTGRTGLVHEAVLQDIPNLADYEVYVCGNPAMVEAAHRAFSARGLPEGAFFSDAFLFSTDPKPAT
ncbi:MAG: CDP-6-deoxy-delta-3,4-glucoseen reductase [Betaproteobacteria bacterium]|nr:CDP-6-deoxy-delta-3,4-glucoseen reductase [Betaproteobacteria bacterium]